MFKNEIFALLGLSAAAALLGSCAVGEIGDASGGARLGTEPDLNADLRASDGWRSVEASQPGFDTLEFEVMARPEVANIDALVAVGAEEIADFPDASIKVRFADNGLIDARDGSVYDSDMAFGYEPGVWYKISISADITTRRYNVRVGRRGERSRALVTDAAFDSEARASDRLTTWAAWSSQSAKLDIAGHSWVASGSCATATCESLGIQCGEPSDGCGGTLVCGGCVNGQACTSGVCENASSPSPPPSCERLTCLSLGIECGVWSDGCGGNLSCGGCASGQTCSGGSCMDVSGPPPPSCEPLTCMSSGFECGVWSDGCGGNLSCGGCPSGQTCTSGVCEDVSPPLPPPMSCVPFACSDIGAQCGNQADGCGGTINCGTCIGGEVCIDGQCSRADSKQFFASRTSCMAPCGVRLDAQPTESLTWAEVRDSEFVWDFDDPGSSDPGSDGFIAAHMFESPGTYNVALTVDGVPWASKSITVSAPSRTVCVSPSSSFGDCPSGAGGDHFTSISSAFGSVSSGSHVLLHRGESHGALPNTGAAGQSGSFLLGAYGTGAKPQLTSDNRRPRSGWTYQDLDVTTIGADAYTFTSDAMDHVVFNRIDSNDGQRLFLSMYAQGPTNWMVFNSNLTKGDYVMFTCCTGLVLKGNTITRTGAYGGYQHAVRIAGTDHALVQDNVFDTQAPHTSLALRGGEPIRNGSDWVLVQGNTFDKYAEARPQNETSSGIEQHIVWEENRHILDTVGGCSLCNAGAFTGHDMVIRNNIIGGEITGGLSVRSHPLVQNQGIEFSNNTME